MSLGQGWGTGPEKTISPECLALPFGTWLLLFFGTGLIFEVPNPAAGELFTLLDLRPESQILVITTSTISMRRYRQPHFRLTEREGQYLSAHLPHSRCDDDMLSK